MTPIDCNELLKAGAHPDYILEVQERNLCAQVDSLPAQMPLETSISGSGIPFPLFILAFVGVLAWGMDAISRQTNRGRSSGPHQLTGGYVGQDALNAANATDIQGENVYTTGIPVHSHSESAPEYTGVYGHLREPNPWAMTEADRYSYQSDRQASDVSTEDCWLMLKDCSFTQFKDKVGAGNIDPVSLVENGQGKIAAKEAANNWFAHDITPTNKVGWAVFGCDGQGGSARAKATAQAVKELRSEYFSIR